MVKVTDGLSYLVVRPMDCGSTSCATDGLSCTCFSDPMDWILSGRWTDREIVTDGLVCGVVNRKANLNYVT